MILATFSLDWFMTIPGMLITGGVLFLIIALVIFIVTGTKKPKTNKEVEKVQEDSKKEAIVATTTPTVEQTPVTNTAPATVTPEPVVTATPVVPTPVSNVEENKETVVVSTPVETVKPIVPPTPVVTKPIEAVEPLIEEKKEVVPPIVSSDMPRPIYGGVSPVVPNVSHEEHRPIYGGANPLENTQSVPIVPPTPVTQPKVDIPVVPTIPTINSTTPSTSSNIFDNSTVVPQPVEPTVTVEPTNNKTEEIESLF